MAFKSKIDPNAVAEMDFKTYTNLLKKEVKKAAAFGETDVIIFSDFTFACGHIGTMMLLGKFSGNLAKFYKKSKIERKTEKDFAKGTCYFKTKEDDNVEMHIALDDGKGKPAKMKKNGKALFRKLGFGIEIIKGELAEDSNEEEASEEETPTLDTVIEEHLTDSSAQENEDKGIRLIAKQYQSAYQLLTLNVLPLLKNNNTQTLHKDHYGIALKAYKLSLSFLDKYKEAKEPQQAKLSDFHKKASDNHPQLQKILAKIKQTLEKGAQVHGDMENMEQLLEKASVLMREINGHHSKMDSLAAQINAKLKELAKTA